MGTAGRVPNLILLSVGTFGLASALVSSPQRSSAPRKISFSRDILPILSDRCFKCHGPDPGSRQADLRLDQPESAFAERGGRQAIVPGKPESSLLIQRINHPDSPMPPLGSGKTLSKEERDLLSQWIAQGAPYGKLWSFEPLPRSVEVPRVGSNWPRSDLDRFILNRLRQEGLSPSPPASRQRWLRRVTFDLTGLPPTLEEIDAFEKDRRQDAFEHVVDRLLASPHYGERIAVDWLDAARYSDSYGYQSDLLMPTWPYRDWVVKALNENIPYNEFLIDQIAGDLREKPTRDQRLATAFNRLHRQSNEGGSIALEFKTEYAVDRVDTFGTSVLGLTLGCARCHDHKFDPISQKEYYQLFAYFNSIEEYGLLLSSEIVPTPSLLLPTKEQEAKLVELQGRAGQSRQALDQARHQALGRFDAWLATNPKLELKGHQVHFECDTTGTSSIEKLGNVEAVDGSKGKGIRFDGDSGLVIRGLAGRERWEPFTWSFWLNDARAKGPVVVLHRTGGTDVGFCGFDLTLEDGLLTARVMRHWPGNAVAIRTLAPIPEGRWTHVAWSWDGSGQAAGLKLYLDGRPAKTRILSDRIWKKINAYGDLAASRGDWTFGQRFRDAGFKGGGLDQVDFVDRELSRLEVAQLLGGSAFISGSESRDDWFDYYACAIDPEVSSARAQMLKAQAELTQFEEGIQEISVMEEAQPEIPAYLLARGQYDSPRTDANRVARGVPGALPSLRASAHNNRLDLAKWATDPDHPLTARVAVNRFWQMLFGVGLVETSENFGMQGSQPTHPELLDYLARRFVDSGWNVKGLLKEMVLSATYRQDSALTKNLLAKDPRNRLLARGPSGRLSAEMVRDLALAASGLLNDKIGGPPVNPYQPAGIWQEYNTMSPGFVQSKGVDLYRRSLYSTWKRTTPVPNMMLFDATSREACTVRRPMTNTPLQALVLLNDVQYVEAARALAEVVLRQPGSDESRLKEVFRRLGGRDPDPIELKSLLRTLHEQKLEYRVRIVDAEKLTSMGDSKPDPKLRPSDLAAMTVVVQTVLNSDAVIWKR